VGEEALRVTSPLPIAEVVGQTLLLSVLCLHNKDSASRAPYDPLGGTSHEELLQPGSSVGAHDDQVRSPSSRGLDNGII